MREEDEGEVWEEEEEEAEEAEAAEEKKGQGREEDGEGTVVHPTSRATTNLPVVPTPASVRPAPIPKPAAARWSPGRSSTPAGAPTSESAAGDNELMRKLAARRASFESLEDSEGRGGPGQGN